MASADVAVPPQAAPPPAQDASATSPAAASTPEAPTTLCAELSSASKALHQTSNNVLNARLIVLFTDRHLYGTALRCFQPVFQALEEQLVLHKDNPDIAACWSSLEQLFRTKGFEEDMEFYLGPGWEKQAPNSALAVDKYVAHLKALGARDPTLLLAHAFTQHLALASGGQIIKRLARKRLKLPEDQGTGAFDFPAVKGSMVPLKKPFMDQLNALGEGLAPERRAQLVEEHKEAFRHNNAIITQFHIGWLNFFKGLGKFLVPSWGSSSTPAPLTPAA